MLSTLFFFPCILHLRYKREFIVYKNKTVVGAFVFGSLILLCLAFFLLGYGNFSSRQTSFALFFDSSLRGLTIDSPVFFKGVPIGAVRSIYIVPNSSGDTFKTVVVIELNDSAGGVDSVNENHNFLHFMDDEKYVRSLISQGLRAKLSTASLITGQLVVELAMISNPEPLSERETRKFNGLIQIPTLPNVFDSILSNVERLPLYDISAQLLLLLENVNTLIAELKLPELRNNLNHVVQNMNGIQKDTKEALQEYKALGELINSKLPSILNQINSFTRNSAKLTQDDSALMQELFVTMQALREAANSISYLAKLLENQPDALIFGKAK